MQNNYRRDFDQDDYNKTLPGVDLARDIKSNNGYVISSTSDKENFKLDLDVLTRHPVEVEVSQQWDQSWTKSYMDIPYSKAIEVKNQYGEFWQFNKSMSQVRIVHHTVLQLVPYEKNIRKGFGLKKVRIKKPNGIRKYEIEPFYRISLDQTSVFNVQIYPKSGGI